ncbi:MAG: hypothetical protein ABIJ15_00940 [bacterium]
MQKKMNLLFVGTVRGADPPNRINALIKMGYDVSILNIDREFFSYNTIKELTGLKSVTNLFYEKKLYSAMKSKMAEAAKMLLSTFHLYENKEVKAKVKEVILKNKINMVYCHWGVTVVPLIALIKNEFPNLPVIHEILTYPSSVNPLEIAFQNFFYGRVVKKIDGRIHCSRRMYDYLNSRFNLKQRGKDLIQPLYFNRRYFYKKRLPALSEKDNVPHIIFIGIGRENFSKKRPSDDIRKKIQEITKLQIHFWISSKNKNIEESDYVHFYPWLNSFEVANGSMATFMTQFDACIYLHNLKKNYAMYENSLQTRFRFALTAGIPIVMPIGYYGACQDIVEKYKIGFAYKDVGELKAKLSDRELMAEYRKNAVRASPEFTFENNFEKLDKFVKEIIYPESHAV